MDKDLAYLNAAMYYIWCYGVLGWNHDETMEAMKEFMDKLTNEEKFNILIGARL